ncbi:hypothetical protein [Actinomycetospora termitidis]|uniref:Uncharacterized protein n=1 Tax=Actinomycetospora termitidis TaxID=3053470 RepID=A0ABT7M8N0_9PSEU|nr:hypothetical protein [Actinomycetospora sp. Odt1-22]MDL5156137.1 hypothetical protein [Actinomycetospora sp. Odt1-22]
MTETWIGDLLDRAGAALLKLEEDGLFMSRFHVSPAIGASFAALRRGEIEAGLPLMVLGAEVVEDPSLDHDEFALVP